MTYKTANTQTGPDQRKLPEHFEIVHRVADAEGCFIDGVWQKEIPWNPGGSPYYTGDFPELYPTLKHLQMVRTKDSL